MTALAAFKTQGEDAQVTAAQATDFLAGYYKEEVNEEVLTSAAALDRAAQ